MNGEKKKVILLIFVKVTKITRWYKKLWIWYRIWSSETYVTVDKYNYSYKLNCFIWKFQYMIKYYIQTEKDKND